jgi:uncharacterized protein YwqG
MFKTSEDIERRLIDEAGVSPQDARTLASLAKPAVWLETRSAHREDEIPLGATKLGGHPDLPHDMPWPVRPPYPHADTLAKHSRDCMTSPDSKWPKATPEQCAAIRADAAQHVYAVEHDFPLSFIAQINFADMWAAGPLDADMPRSGMLYVFYDMQTQPWGFDPRERIGCSIAFHDVASESLSRREAPSLLDALPEQNKDYVLACHAWPCITPLPLATAQCRALGLSSDTIDKVHAWWSEKGNLYATEGGTDWKCHHVGGWPNPIQGDMQTECALASAGYYCGDSASYRAPELAPIRAQATDWLLLAQIGSDDSDHGMMWGDDGQLYVWIKRDDLVARRFDRAHLILQCY